jgi:hypothetical protein
MLAILLISALAAISATIAAAAAAAAAVPTAATTGRSRFSGASFIYCQRPAFHCLAIEFRNGVLSVLVRTHRDESKATRLARESVLHESDFLHSASL